MFCRGCSVTNLSHRFLRWYVHKTDVNYPTDNSFPLSQGAITFTFLIFTLFTFFHVNTWNDHDVIFDNSEVSSTNIWAERQFIETFILVCILRGLLWLLFSLSGNLPVTNDIRALCIIILSRNGPITSSAFSFSMSKESKIWISKINIEIKTSDNSSLISGWGDFLRTDLWEALRLLENNNKYTTEWNIKWIKRLGVREITLSQSNSRINFISNPLMLGLKPTE